MFASCGSASRLSKADTPWTYEIESVGVGADGTYAIRVWSYYKNAKMPLEVAKRNAVHAVIFKGVPAGNGAASQPPLKTDAVTASDSVFFGNFFQGEYQDYINSVASGSRQVLKVKGRSYKYKIGYVISVAKDRLRKRLEEQGVVRALSDGF
jgi:hypothetical protein